MSRLRFTISMSLDGYVAGPDQTREEPLGRGGERLHDWVVRLRSWRESHGRERGAEGVDDEILRESTANVGATIMGRNMFGGHPGPWDPADPWRGWWGQSPPTGATSPLAAAPTWRTSTSPPAWWTRWSCTWCRSCTA